jgi:hypothetical protein
MNKSGLELDLSLLQAIARDMTENKRVRQLASWWIVKIRKALFSL